MILDQWREMLDGVRDDRLSVADRVDWVAKRRVIGGYRERYDLRPDDASVRQNLIELNLRLAQVPQAQAELESYISYLESNNKSQETIPFIGKLFVRNTIGKDATLVPPILYPRICRHLGAAVEAGSTY